jgi:hypothetical protein
MRMRYCIFVIKSQRTAYSTAACSHATKNQTTSAEHTARTTAAATLAGTTIDAATTYAKVTTIILRGSVIVFLRINGLQGQWHLFRIEIFVVKLSR